MPTRPLRIALLSYRAHPHVGGQGIYVRYLSRALVRLGHEVEVLAGPPYPELDLGVTLVRVPGLDLYRPEQPFRRPGLHEFRDGIDLLEYGLMCTAAFPEPLAFSLRAARLLAARAADFDVVHDNQCLGYGLLAVQRRLPLVVTVHHPVSIDRRHDLAAATGRRAASLRRWYSFVRMQSRVARRVARIVTVSEAAADDVVREFGVDAARMRVVHNGVDPELFRPLPGVQRVAGRIVTLASSDAPVKGLPVLIEALAKLRTELPEAHLVVVGKGDTPAARAEATRLGVDDAVTFTGRVDDLELVALLASARVAAIPSLYEGFSLPAVEAMASGTALVTTTGGALPEVVGPPGEAALLVPPGDPAALAEALRRVLEDPLLAGRLGRGGRRRALERFTWEAAARSVVGVYREVVRC